MPDAVQMLATRVVAIDHVQGLTHLLALGREGEAEVQWWLDEASVAVREVLAASTHEGKCVDARGGSEVGIDAASARVGTGGPLAGEDVALPGADTDVASPGAAAGPVSFRCGRGRRQYLADILRCQAELAAGESYEVCLTDQLSTARPRRRLSSTARYAAPTLRRSRPT